MGIYRVRSRCRDDVVLMGARVCDRQTSNGDTSPTTSSMRLYLIGTRSASEGVKDFVILFCSLGVFCGIVKFLDYMYLTRFSDCDRVERTGCITTTTIDLVTV